MLQALLLSVRLTVVVVDDMDVSCDDDIGLRKLDCNPSFQPVQVG